MRKDLKGTAEQGFFFKYWAFVQEHYIPEDTDEWWSKTIKDCDDLLKEANDIEWLKETLMVFMKELEKKSKKT